MAPTGTLKVVTPKTTEVYEWNGIPEEREAARAEFDKRMSRGQFMASVVESPGKRTQIRTFDEVERFEKERGTVLVTLNPALVGG